MCFKENNIEIKRNYIKDKETISIIKILVDNNLISLNGLFEIVNALNQIIFSSFIEQILCDMSFVFLECS